MAALFDGASLPVPCPHCGKKHKKTVRWLRTHKLLACSCGESFDIDAKQLLRAVEQANQSADQLRRKLRGAFKKR
jgi:transcription elongation factor Elf1